MNKIIIYDFDGVLTDNRVHIDQNGNEAVICNRSDGLAISILRKNNINQIIVSTEKNPVVSSRAKKLKLTHFQGVEDKKKFICKYSLDNNIDLEKSIYVGNDLNDLEAMRLFGLKICPNDAYPCVKQISDIITKTSGGFGVIRELIENNKFLKFLNLNI